MSRKKKYAPKDFESTGVSSDTSANIYNSMIVSEAYRSLTKNQRLLYLYMKNEYYSVPRYKHPNEQQDMFYFNKFVWSEKYKLYKNDAAFAKDRDALIEKGFIKVKDKGFNTKTKAEYQFSSEWRKYNTAAFVVSASDKSVSLIRKEKKENSESCERKE